MVGSLTGGRLESAAGRGGVVISSGISVVITVVISVVVSILPK